MRQMVLNHASVHPTGSSREAVSDWLADLSKGMAKLVDDRVVESQLRTEQEPYQTPCLADYSLFDAFLGLREAGYREQSRFLLSLSTKAPWPTLVTDESKSLKQKDPDSRRFASCRGTRELFTWHARVGNGYRIHLRLDAGLREVEIGYIGPHLPL